MNELPKLRVLIAAPESSACTTLGKRLRELPGWKIAVTNVPSAQSALSTLRDKLVDMAFLCRELPDEDGLKLLEQVRQLHPKIAVVMMAGKGSEKVAVEAMRRGAIDFILPDDIETGDMGQLLRRALEMQLLQGENRELRQVNRMKDEFISSVSHELRTPLAVILGYAKTMEDNELGDLNPQQTMAVKAIRRRGERLLDMLNRLLTFKESTAGTQEAMLRSTDLTALVREVMETKRPEADSKSMEVSFDLPQDPVWIMSDPEQLREVVNALISNAVKFSPEKTRVEVELELHSPEEAWLSVKDQGRGIPKESLPRLFEAFYHTDRDLTREVSGLGLGLVLSRQVIELHGGRIWVESEGPGRGTTARVALPVVRPDAPPMVVQQQRKADKKRVLVVEDNADIIEIIRLFLMGFSDNIVLTTTERGQEALDLISSQTYDLAILDLFLPGISGFDILERMQRLPKAKRAPVLILSGHQEAAKRALRKGADDWLLKPFNKNRFIDKVLQLLGLERRAHPRA